MATSRDSLFMRKNTLLIKQVHFYACKIQIKPGPYPLSRDRSTAHHHYPTAGTASTAPVHAKLNLFHRSASDKTTELTI